MKLKNPILQFFMDYGAGRYEKLLNLRKKNAPVRAFFF